MKLSEVPDRLKEKLQPTLNDVKGIVESVLKSHNL